MNEQWEQLDVQKTLDIFFKILGLADNCEYKYKIIPKIKQSVADCNQRHKQNITK